MSEWVALCAERDRAALRVALLGIDPGASLELVGSADALRGAIAEAVPGELCALVGPSADGVSPVNLAAAIVSDGGAQTVALAERGVTGSLRSRAARAGIDLVIDLDAAIGTGDGGRPVSPVVPAPPPRPVAIDVAGPRAPLVVMCSGRGGVGKTSIVATAAAHAALWGLDVCAVDLDLACGNLFSCFGLSGGSDLSRLSAVGSISPEVAEGMRVTAHPGLSVVGPCDRPETSELAAARAGELLSALATSCDLLLVDTSPTFTDAVAQAAQLADRLVIVSDGGPGATAALARTSGLAVRLGVARTRIARIENRANPREHADLSTGRAEVGLETARVFRTFEGGLETEDLLASGRAIDLAESGSPFSDSVASALAQMLAELGRLPDAEGARRAAGGEPRWHRGLFGLRREAR